MKTLTGKYILISLFSILILVFACRKKDNTPEQNGATPYVEVLPSYFPELQRSSENPSTIEGVELGRHLYYDTLLSLGGPNEGKACASCHLQETGFAFPGMAVLPHINLAWNKHFLWKGNISGSMEDILQFEVNEFFASQVSRLNQNPQYPGMYKKAFGTEDITSLKTAYALAQFMKTLVSSNSPYDQFLRNEKTLSDAEMRGYNIFFSEKGDCYHCHGSPLFTDNDFHNIGLVTKSQNDMGRYLVTGNSADVGKFKTPTLRNVALRDVFMHDGRFKSLHEVVTHYNKDIVHGEYLDPLLDRPFPGLSDPEINELIAFLNTLTDSTFTHNPKLSRP